MANRRMNLSREGKEILDIVTDQLEVERPLAVKIALAKGIQISTGRVNKDFSGSNDKWTIPDNIIKEKDFLLFKHLIIQEANQHLNEEELHEYMINYIEKGLRAINQIGKEKTSMEDLKISII